MNKLMKVFAAGAAILFAHAAQADTEMVAGYEWTYNLVNGKTATITGTDFWLVGAVEIPSKLGGKAVTVIGPNAFNNRQNFYSVTIPSSVTEISTNAFNNCASLRAVKIPDAVTTIGPSAFSKCSSLMCVDFGKKVNVLGETLFTSCPKLEALVFRGNAPAEVSDQNFSGVAAGCSVYVPKSAKNWPKDGETWQGLPVVVGDRLVKVAVESSANAWGTVTGSGEFAVGKKVTFKAKANKNCVFGGWVETGSKTVLSYSTSYAYTVDGYHLGGAPMFTARFETNANDFLMMELPWKHEAWGGYVNLDMRGHVRTYSEPKLTFKGLPSGVKYDAKTFLLSGLAKTPGEYKVDVTASNVSKISVSDSFIIVVPNYTDSEINVNGSYGPFIPGVAYVETIANAAGCKVTGLPTGMKWTDKAITDKTLGDIEAYSVYGTPTKPGSYTVFFTKTTEDKKKHEATATFKVGAFPQLTIEVSGATGKNKVTGEGGYAANAKVSLKATADTSSKDASEKKVFSCWKDKKGVILSREASYSYVMPSVDTTLTAVFITAEEDKNFTAELNGGALPAPSQSEPVSLVTNVMCGVALQWPFAVEALSATSVKVAGLPSGLKFTAKDIVDSKTKDVIVPANTIYGVPTAASKTDKNGVKPSDVKITVTTAGKSSATYVVQLYVDKLPAWAVGDFNGMVKLGKEGVGVASMSVKDKGSISGKASFLGTNWTFKADSYDISSTTTLGTTNLVIFATATAGKATCTVSIEQSPPEETVGGDEVSSGDFGGYDAYLYRIPWTDKAKPEMADLMKSLVGEYVCNVSYDGEQYEAAFKLDAKGVAKGAVVLPDGTKTRKATFSSTAILVGGEPYVVIYIPPDAKKGYPAVYQEQKVEKE